MSGTYQDGLHNVNRYTIERFDWSVSLDTWLENTNDDYGITLTTTFWNSLWAPFFSSRDIPTWNVSPNVYWPDGPEDLVNCSNPPVDCLEKQGEEYWSQDTVKYDIASALCDPDGCEVTINTRAKRDGGDYHYIGTYTGQECSGDPEPDPQDDCVEFEAMCEDFCAGQDLVDMQCDEATDTYICDCEYPDFPLVYNPTTGNTEPDQDDDGEGSSTDTDVDGDGTDNGSDSDVDGDSEPNGSDQDTDGDGTDNRGVIIYTNDNWGSHNGYGSDADLDGDGTTNGSDPDIDGDGILNGSDPDMDGDGVPNGSDIDSDGDGLIDGSDPDSDGDGISDGDDSDPDGSEVSDADTDGDGDVDSDDPPAPEEDVPTEEDVEAELGDITDNEYDSTIEGDFNDPDIASTVQGYIDGNPLADEISGSSLTFSGSDPCFYFTNPYEDVTEQYCLNPYESYFNAMGLILLGLTGFMCFRIIKG